MQLITWSIRRTRTKSVIQNFSSSTVKSNMKKMYIGKMIFLLLSVLRLHQCPWSEITKPWPKLKSSKRCERLLTVYKNKLCTLRRQSISLIVQRCWSFVTWFHPRTITISSLMCVRLTGLQKVPTCNTAFNATTLSRTCQWSRVATVQFSRRINLSLVMIWSLQWASKRSFRQKIWVPSPLRSSTPQSSNNS